ncbi:MAG: aminotransferase class I/II-fold pyridoxal phosphate-dependent enzyme [Oxalobacteraceae bacterium]
MLQAQVAKLLDCITICPPRIGQLAALYGLRHLADWRDEKRRLMLARNTLMQTMFEQAINGFRLVSSGAYFAYLEHPFTAISAYDVARHLADAHNVLCLPGTMFGPGQQRFLRVAFANLDTAQISEFGRRLRDVAV